MHSREVNTERARTKEERKAKKGSRSAKKRSAIAVASAAQLPLRVRPPLSLERQRMALAWDMFPQTLFFLFFFVLFKAITAVGSLLKLFWCLPLLLVSVAGIPKCFARIYKKEGKKGRVAVPKKDSKRIQASDPQIASRKFCICTTVATL